MISYSVSRPSGRTESFLERMIKGDPFSNLDQYGQRGVDALRAATPVEGGLTAASWVYEIVRKGDDVTIWWSNTNQQNGFHVAIGLQYGHATGTGGWVEGYDYINPALRPIFDEIAAAVWKEVTRA